MYCVSCGKQLNDSDNFCAKCGTTISQEKPSENQIDVKSTTPSETNQISGIVQTIVKNPSKIYWIIYVGVSLMIIGAAASMFIPILADKKIDYGVLAVLAFWIGVASAVRGKQKNQSAWLWFFGGFLGIGMILFCVVSFLAPVIMK